MTWEICIQVLVTSQTSCVIQSKSFSLSVPHFPICIMGIVGQQGISLSHKWFVKINMLNIVRCLDTTVIGVIEVPKLSHQITAKFVTIISLGNDPGSYNNSFLSSKKTLLQYEEQFTFSCEKTNNLVVTLEVLNEKIFFST